MLDPSDSYEHTASSWAELVATFLAPMTGWIFRGQGRYDWNLRPRLVRRLEEAGHPSDEWQDREQSLIGFFKDRARSQLQRPPDEGDLLGWLSIMQHYRAPTRLLDWTRSPFVAAFFACSSRESASNDAAVWALNAYFCRRQHVGSLFPLAWDHLGVRAHSQTDSEGETQLSYPSLEVNQRDKENNLLRQVIRSQSSWPLPILPFEFEARMTAQQAVFTCSADLNTPVDHLADKEAWTDSPPPPVIGTDSAMWTFDKGSDLVRKFRIPVEWRQEVLHSLHVMGITYDSLFPGLDGVGEATALEADSPGSPLRDVLTGLF